MVKMPENFRDKELYDFNTTISQNARLNSKKSEKKQEIDD